MKSIMLAIAAMAFATLAPLALAAEGQGDNAEKQPTMAELKAKMNSISTEIAALAGTVGNLATATVGTASTSLASKVDALASTVTANHTTIVGKFSQQTAVVMTVPYATTTVRAGYFGTYYLVGDSSIAGFPAGTVAANGQFNDNTLPTGTYLFELQQPYSDNVLCNRSVAKRQGVGGNRFNNACPRLRLHLVPRTGTFLRFDDGPVVYDFETTGGSFVVLHKFPTGFAFTDDKPVTSYGGAVRITKLK